MSANLSVVTPIAFTYRSSQSLDRSNVLRSFVLFVALVEYAVSVLIAYLQAALDGMQIHTRSLESPVYLESSYQPTSSRLLPLLVTIIRFICFLRAQNSVRGIDWSEAEAETLLDYNLDVGWNKTLGFLLVWLR